jgi:MFS family permease
LKTDKPGLSIEAERPAGLHGRASDGLSRSTIVIGIVSLFADISTEVMYPLLPAFVTDVLKAPVTALGLIEGVAQGVSSVVSGISGWLSDRLGQRKLVAFTGYALTAIAKPIIGRAGAWPVVLVARFGDRFGKGIRTAPKDALLADSVTPSKRGKAFGFERAMDSTGAVLGPLLALALTGGLGFGARTIFYLATIPAAAAALLILAVRDERPLTARARESLRLSIAGTTPTYRRLMVITAFFGLANSANAFLILRAGKLGLGTGWTILAYALYNAVAAIVSMPAGSASDKLGRRNLLIVGYAIYAVVYAGFGAASTAWVVWPLFAAYGLFPALTDGVGKALAVDTAGKAGHATAIGIYSMIVGVTQVAASFIGGKLWDAVSPAAPFYAGAILAAAAAVLSFVLLPARIRGIGHGETDAARKD